MGIIKLQAFGPGRSTPDGNPIPVDSKVAELSTTIYDMLESCGEGDDDDLPVPILNVDGKTLKKVVEWLNHHKDDPEPLEQEYKQLDDLSPWDRQFLKMDQSQLYDVILAANYLDIRKLLEISCMNVAYMIKGKTPEEIRQLFNIQNDFSSEEEQVIAKENSWCEEM